jgi:hypothetical protein
LLYWTNSFPGFVRRKRAAPSALRQSQTYAVQSTGSPQARLIDEASVVLHRAAKRAGISLSLLAEDVLQVARAELCGTRERFHP